MKVTAEAVTALFILNFPIVSLLSPGSTLIPHQYLTNVQCWNRRFGSETIPPTQEFNQINLFQVTCVIKRTKKSASNLRKKEAFFLFSNVKKFGCV